MALDPLDESVYLVDGGRLLKLAPNGFVTNLGLKDVAKVTKNLGPGSGVQVAFEDGNLTWIDSLGRSVDLISSLNKGTVRSLSPGSNNELLLA